MVSRRTGHPSVHRKGMHAQALSLARGQHEANIEQELRCRIAWLVGILQVVDLGCELQASSNNGCIQCIYRRKECDGAGGGVYTKNTTRKQLRQTKQLFDLP